MSSAEQSYGDVLMQHEARPNPPEPDWLGCVPSDSGEYGFVVYEDTDGIALAEAWMEMDEHAAIPLEECR